MNRLLRVVLMSTISLAIGTTVVYADVKKGQKLFTKKLKNDCNMTGSKMAAKHSQDEWESIYENGKLEIEIKKICPKTKEIKAKYLDHYYDFFYEYANDSGNIPSCR